MPPTIFIVDDDASFLTAVARMLRAAGFAVRVCLGGGVAGPAGTGCAGVCAGGSADARLSGRDLQEALAKAGHMLPVIFLSGHGDIPSTVQAMRRGAEDFLTKRAPKEKLLVAVKRALARERASAPNVRGWKLCMPALPALTPRELEVLSTLSRASRTNKSPMTSASTSAR